MQVFIAIFSDKQNGRLTDDLVQRHVDHLRLLSDDGHLRICGPLADDQRAVQILQAPSWNEAVRIVEADPFVTERYYKNYELVELFAAGPENNWLQHFAHARRNLAL